MTLPLRRLVCSIAAGLLIVAGVSAPESASATLASAYTASTSATSTYADTVFSATNHQRQIHNRRVLRHQTCLTRYAVAWARKMGGGLGLVHQSLRPILRECHLSEVGENIAMGFPTGGSVVKAWMNSPLHRANILHRTYRRMGVGAYRDAAGVWWVSQVFGRPA